jgi:hypothetical protein
MLFYEVVPVSRHNAFPLMYLQPIIGESGSKSDAGKKS